MTASSKENDTMTIMRRPLTYALVMLSFLVLGPAFNRRCQAEWSSTSGLPQPSALRLQDYESQLFAWLFHRKYEHWRVDKTIRDTGPFINGENYGTHSAVRIYYSPEVLYWLTGDPADWPQGKVDGKPITRQPPRTGAVANGGVVVKELFTPPAAIYEELRGGLQKKFAGDPQGLKQAESDLLKTLVVGWTVMVKDGDGSKDGWFWAYSGSATTLQEMLDANLDSYKYDFPKNPHPVNSDFGNYVCMRCHSSAAKELLFSDTKNITGFPGEPLRFRNDNSWRSRKYLLNPETKSKWTANEKALAKARDEAGVTAQFPLPDSQIPWSLQSRPAISFHSRPLASLRIALQNTPQSNKFLDAYKLLPVTEAKAFPYEYADRAFPGPGGPGESNKNPYEFITSDSCVGCHGGLGGAPSGVTMFLQTGPKYGDGYNVSEYGEWRWSPMGLAGRDPIFHSQLECEMIMILQDSLKKPSPLLNASVAATQQALINTCLRCHGAMGQRQLQIDAEAGRTLPGGEPIHGDFNPEYFYLYKLASSKDPYPSAAPQDSKILHPNPRYKSDKNYYDYHKYGALAREGISCMICHRIAPPSAREVTDWVAGVLSNPGERDWLNKANSNGVNSLAYLLMKNTTGTFQRNEKGNELYGPFEDVMPTPMRNSLGITPKAAPPAFGAWPDPHTGKTPTFTQDSQMCGTCHVINLPNIGQKFEKSNVLNSAETVPALGSYNHSIEQATFLEWQNSDFGPGLDNRPKKGLFKSCQNCHMPGGFESLDGTIKIDQLVTQIAAIQDRAFPQAENEAPGKDLNVRSRSNYRRHQLVGLNAFLLEMTRQFPEVLGVDPQDQYMLYDTPGSSLAMESMRLQAKNSTVKVEFVGQPTLSNGTLEAKLQITNLTGHRFPSGVSFRRAFVEFVVRQNGKIIWESGRTDEAGVILGSDGKPLKTEFLDQVTEGNVFASYQPHYQVITSPDQVQIYEELILDGEVPPAGTSAAQLPRFTTSFIHRITHVKDNRLLPKGWVPSHKFASQGQVLEQFMKATDPEGPSVVGGDPLIGAHPLPNGGLESSTASGPFQYRPDLDFTNAPSTGSDNLTYKVSLQGQGIDPSALEVTATVYSQSLMPAWLHQRFSQAAWAKKHGYPTPETDRLLYVASRLNLENTAIENWKMQLASPVKAVVKGR